MLKLTTQNTQKLLTCSNLFALEVRRRYIASCEVPQKISLFPFFLFPLKDVETLHYKSEVHGFDSQWCHWNFSLTIALISTQPLTEMSTSNISWGSKGCRCAGLTTLSPSCADCLEVWGAPNSWNLQGMSKFVKAIALPLPLPRSITMQYYRNIEDRWWKKDHRKCIFKVNYIFRILVLLLHVSALQERHLEGAQSILMKLCVCYVISANI
jgi:hypothetical protein